jgi:phage shock protein E
MMNLLKNMFGNSNTENLGTIIQEGAFLVDVRTPQEFAESKVNGSVNIPLDRVASHIDKFKGKKNIVVFCRSGNRSGQAKSILEKNGITHVFNGGSVGNVKQYVK